MNGGRNRGARLLAASLPALLLGFLFLTSLAEPLPGLGVYDGKRLLLCLALALGLLLSLLTPGARSTFAGWFAALPRPVGLALLGALSMGLVSALAHPPVAYPLAEVAMLALLPCAAVALAVCRRTLGSRFDRPALGVITALCLGLALQEVMGVLAGRATGTPHNAEAMALYFADPRFFNQLQTWCIPILAVLPWVMKARRRWTAIAVLVLALQWWLLLLSGGRGSLLGLGVALASAGAVLAFRRPGWLAVQGAGLALGILVFSLHLAWLSPSNADTSEAAVAGAVQQQSLERMTRLDSTGRTRLWAVAFRAGLRHPWLGVGPSRYPCVGPPGMGAHPHNLPLQLWVEWGIPATLMLALAALWLAGAVGRCFWRRRNSRDADEALRQVLTVSLLAAAVHALFSGILMAPASQAAGILVGGWLLALAVPTAPKGASRAAWRALPWAAVALSLGLALFCLEQARQPREGASEELAPRFWQTGFQCPAGDSNRAAD